MTWFISVLVLRPCTEFTWNILLRKSQLAMIEEFRQTIESGGSIVQQLLMGSGKTTVVSPLLCLMLGDGKHLVCQVVPPALLEFSRSVLRSSFASVIQKTVYTFSFDRSSVMTEATLKKLKHARHNAGVVVSTPSAIKSLMLRYLENLTILRQKDTTASLSQSTARYERFLANQRKLIESLQLITNTGERYNEKSVPIEGMPSMC